MIAYRRRIKTARYRACEDRLFNRRMLRALPSVRKILENQQAANIPAAEQVSPWSALAERLADQVVATVGTRTKLTHQYTSISRQGHR